jgi:4-amino-4-deoxy-L-arabinose transferase-like glycosyltransferase
VSQNRQRHSNVKHRLILFAAILIAGAVLRIVWNDIDADDFSPDDEQHYVDDTVYLVQHGWASYPELTRAHIADPKRWIYPGPLRWGHLLLTTAACKLSTECGPRALANLSTFAGILSILFTFLIGRVLLGDEAALVAAALAVTSPLQLGMGRRALQDEVLCAAALLTILLLCQLVARPPESALRRRFLIAAALISTTLTVSMKESFVFYFPAILAMLFLLAPRPRRKTLMPAITILAMAPIVSAAIFSVLSRSLTAYVALWRIDVIQVDAPFAMQYQQGPFERPLFDLLLLSPIVTVLAIAAAGRVGKNAGADGLNALAGFALVSLTVFGLFSSKNARYVIVVDAVDRLLAASLIVSLPRRPWLSFAVIALIAATELSLFHTLFEIGDLFDPLTYNLLKVLKVVP